MKFYRHLSATMLMLIGTVLLLGCGDHLPKSGGDNFSVESAYIQESGEHLTIEAEYPILKGFPKAEEVNMSIKETVEAAAADVRNAASSLENREGFSASLNSSYQYFHNNNNIVSLWISWDNYTGGAHGLYWLDSYTLNTDTGAVYSFPQLFQDGSGGVEYVTEKILSEIARSNGYFDTAAETVTGYHGEYNFLINGEELIVYFQLYDIAPYVAGIQSFSFPASELEFALKPEVFHAMQGQEPVLIQFLPKPES